jgi:hypothetical protein
MKRLNLDLPLVLVLALATLLAVLEHYPTLGMNVQAALVTALWHVARLTALVVALTVLLWGVNAQLVGVPWWRKLIAVAAVLAVAGVLNVKLP